MGLYNSMQTAGTPVALSDQTGTVVAGSGTGPFGISIGGIIIVGATAGIANLAYAQNTSDLGTLICKANSHPIFTPLN